jgi:hypothetical protein
MDDDDDEPKTIDDLKRAFLGLDLSPDPLDGFDFEIVGFDCAGWTDEPGRCPFNPGCGGSPGPGCELMQRRTLFLASVAPAPNKLKS